MVTRTDKIMSLLKEAPVSDVEKAGFQVKNKRSNHLTQSGDKVISTPSSSVIEINDENIKAQDEGNGQATNCFVGDLESYAAETEEVLLNQISQEERYVIVPFEDSSIIQEASNCNATPKLGSKNEIPFVQKTFFQHNEMDEDPDYRTTIDEMEEETSVLMQKLTVMRYVTKTARKMKKIAQKI